MGAAVVEVGVTVERVLPQAARSMVKTRIRRVLRFGCFMSNSSFCTVLHSVCSDLSRSCELSLSIHERSPTYIVENTEIMREGHEDLRGSATDNYKEGFSLRNESSSSTSLLLSSTMGAEVERQPGASWSLPTCRSKNATATRCTMRRVQAWLSTESRGALKQPVRLLPLKNQRLMPRIDRAYDSR